MEGQTRRELEPQIGYMALAQNELVLYVVLIKLASEALKRSRQQYWATFNSGAYNPLRDQLRLKLASAYTKLVACTECLCNEVDEGVIQAMVAAAPLMQWGDEAVLQEVIEALQRHKDS